MGILTRSNNLNNKESKNIFVQSFSTPLYYVSNKG